MFKELFISNYIQNKTTFIPYGYLKNELYLMYNISIDGDLEEDESIDENYISISYDYVNRDADKYDMYRDTEECLLNEELREQIDNILEQLNEREEAVIRMRFGLVDDRTDYTLEDIARELRVTRERVRQIESSAIKKLKHPNVGKMLKNYTFDIDLTIKDTRRYDYIAKFWIDILIQYNNYIYSNYLTSLAKTRVVEDFKMERISESIKDELDKIFKNKRSLVIDTSKEDNIINKIFRNNYMFIDLLPKNIVMYIDKNEKSDLMDVEIDVNDVLYELDIYRGAIRI